MDTTLLIVRHPLGRLVSAFESKMVRLGLTQWDRVRRYIINKYREGGKEFLATEEQLYGEREFDDPKDDPRLVRYILFLRII